MNTTRFIAFTALLSLAVSACSDMNPISKLPLSEVPAPTVTNSTSGEASPNSSSPEASAAYNPKPASPTPGGINEDGDVVGDTHSWAFFDDPKTAFPVTIDHVYGKTTIEKQPKRLVTLDIASTGAAIALVRVPHAFPKDSGSSNAQGVPNLMAAVLESFEVAVGAPDGPALLDMTNGIPIDQVRQANPDVILALQDDLSESDYKRLSEIAPTVVRAGRTGETSPTDLLLTTGKALGQYNHAKELTKDGMKNYPPDGGDYSMYEGKTVIVAQLPADPSKPLAFYPEKNVRTQLIAQFGFVPAEAVKTYSATGNAQTFDWPAAKASEASSDVVITFAKSNQEAEQIRNNPVVQTLPAVQNGNLVIITDPTIANGLASGDPISDSEMESKLDKLFKEQAKLS